MPRMGMGRLIAGGLLAGLVLSGADFVISNFLLADQWQDVARRHSVDRARMGGDAALVTMLAVDFLLGFVLVFTYAAIRPRFGPGPKTAVMSGFLLWFAITIVCAGFMAMGMFTVQAYMKTSALTLVSAIVPSLVGAAIYKE